MMSDRGSSNEHVRHDPLSRAVALMQHGQSAEAAPLLQRALSEDPQNPVALHQLGLIAAQLGRHDRAVRLMRSALRAGGQTAELLNDLGSVFVRSGDFDSASRCFQRCIDHYPTSSLGYISLAYLENSAGRYEQAESLYRQAIANADQAFEARFNLATMQREWGRLDEAIHSYDALLADYPGTPMLIDGRGRSRLQQGNWRKGWIDYEARLQIEDEPAKINLTLPIARWNGETLQDRHLLILHEQGVGDEVQFAACYGDAIAQAAVCTITCAPRLEAVLHRSFPEARLIPVMDRQREHWCPPDPQAYDYVIPAASLPRWFRNQDHDFSGRPYLIPPERPDWRQESTRLRIGISWWGGALPDQINKRSIPFDRFQRLLQVPGVDFVCVQHGHADSASRQQMSQFPNLESTRIDAYQDLDSWLALIDSLDLLVSVDNSNVHFAGALGVPTWLLLPDHPNWRWPLHLKRSQWYPCVEFIRKQRHGCWEGVIDAVGNRLRALANGGHRDLTTSPPCAA